MVTEADLELGDGRTLYYYDTREDEPDACGALLSDRVIAVVSMSASAPFDAEGLDWFAGWSPSGAAEQRAALAGPDARAYLATAEADPEAFTPDDLRAPAGRWSWVAEVFGQAIKKGHAGIVDDSLASARAWGFALADVTVPVLVMHGAKDRMVPGAPVNGSRRTARQPNSALFPTPLPDPRRPARSRSRGTGFQDLLAGGQLSLERTEQALERVVAYFWRLRDGDQEVGTAFVADAARREAHHMATGE